MRLKRLDLTRYGKFTNYRLELGDKPSHGPDLHIVVGPNEAGKSTAFNGWLDLLFEIEPTSRYGFKHGYSSMEVGGVLEWNGQAREFVRVKRQTGSLRDGAGNAIDPALLAAALHGLTRDGYKNMFSLDDITIEKGGKDILASKGEVGEMLFAASAGLPELARAMEEVRSDARKFHAPRLRNSRLSTLKQELKRIDAELRGADIPASQYQRLADELDNARKALGEARDRKRTCEATHAKFAAIADVQAMAPDLARLEAGLAELGGPAGLPETLEAELERLARDEAGFVATMASLKERLDGVEASLAGLQPDEVILSLKPRILAAREAEARHLSASADLPRRREEHAAATTDIAEVLTALGLPPSPEPTRSWAEAGRIERVSQAATSLQACEKSIARAELELERNEKALAEIEGEVGDTAPTSQDRTLADAATLLAVLEPEALVARQDAAKAALDDAAIRFSARLRQLPPWQGDEARFLALAPPAMDAAMTLREEALALAQASRTHADRIVQCEEALGQAREILAGHAKLRTAPDNSEAQKLRHERDAAWQLHLGRLDRDSAQAFEAAMRADDAATATRLSASGEIAALREAGLAVARLTGERASLETGQKDLASRQAVLERAFLSLLEGTGLEAGLSPSQLPDWLERYQTALDEHSALQRCRATATRLDEEVQAACTRIAGYLAMPEPKPADAAGLRMLAVRLARRANEDAAQAALAVSRAKNLKNAGEGVRQRRAEMDEAERARHSAEGELRDALSDYPTSLSSLSASALSACLPTLRRLPALLAKQTELSHRIATMVHDQAVFSGMAETLAKAAREEAGGDPAAMLARLSGHLQRSEQEAAQRTMLEADHISLQDRIAETQVALDAINLQVSAHAARFSGEDQPSGLADLREAAQRDRQARQMAGEAGRLEGLILQRLGVSNRTEADALLESVAGPELAARLAAAASENAEAGAALEVAIAREAGARAALEAVGSDDRAARLEEERTTILETIAEEAHEALQLRLGLMAAERALVRYRDENRSSMLADTAAAFTTITGGEFTELRTIPDGSGEALVAIRGSDRGSITAQDMSKGTRFQLYLALRIAGYRRFCEAAGPLPFVADDIFESFDDGRTRAALLLLGEIGKLGQALYFTHHEHVATLAREVFGDQVRLHRLTG